MVFHTVLSKPEPIFPETAMQTELWNIQPREEVYLRIQIQRGLLIAVIVSLLIHLLLMFFVFRLRLEGVPKSSTEAPLVVTLGPPQPEAATENVTKAPEMVPEHQPKPETVKPLRKKRPETPPKNKVMVSRAKEKSDFTMPLETPAPVASPPSQEAAPQGAPPTDMMSYVNAARARRASAENSAALENAEAEAKERKPTDDERRAAIIQRNLNAGTNGVFQILRKNTRDATFSFRGWTTNASNYRREVIQVELGNHSDIEHAIVRKMIELIRRYYKGDFTWESQRLGRDVRLSARVEDNDGLEDFMMKEFFGAGGISAQ